MSVLARGSVRPRSRFFTPTSERPAALASWACVQLRNPRACTDLSGRDHSYTIVEYVRNDNFGLPCVSSSLHSFVCHNAPKGYPHCLIYLIDDQRYSWHVCPGGASAGAVAQRSPPRT